MRHRKQNCSSFSDCLHYFNRRDRCSSTFLYIVINDDDFGCLVFVFRWNMCECVSEVENVSSSEFLLIKEITFVLWLRLLRLYLCLRELLLSWPHFGSFVLCFSFLLSPLLSLSLSPNSPLCLSSLYLYSLYPQSCQQKLSQLLELQSDDGGATVGRTVIDLTARHDGRLPSILTWGAGIARYHLTSSKRCLLEPGILGCADPKFFFLMMNVGGSDGGGGTAAAELCHAHHYSLPVNVHSR